RRAPAARGGLPETGASPRATSRARRSRSRCRSPRRPAPAASIAASSRRRFSWDTERCDAKEADRGFAAVGAGSGAIGSAQRGAAARAQHGAPEELAYSEATFADLISTASTGTFWWGPLVA